MTFVGPWILRVRVLRLTHAKSFRVDSFSLWRSGGYFAHTGFADRL